MLTDLCRSQLSDRNNDFPFHDSATEDYDCNVAMVSEAIELVTGEKLDAATVRQLGGAVGPKPTGSVLARQVFNAKGLAYGTDFVILRDAPTTALVDLLKGGWFVGAYVMYGRLGELEPDLICDNYQDAHCVGLFDLWRHGGRKTHMADPLADGRRSGHLGRRVHQGVQTWPFPSVREGLWAYSEQYGGGTGLVSGWAVRPK